MNKWIYFLPQFAMLFPCCSENPLCPWTGILSRAVSSAWNSASDSSTFQEPRFSRILPWFLDPGIGTTFGYLCSIQLNEIWALVAAFFSAYSSSSASTGWFASIFSLRTSSLWEKSEFTVSFPEACSVHKLLPYQRMYSRIHMLCGSLQCCIPPSGSHHIRD